MSQPPTPYSRQYNFAGWSVSNPTTPHQGNKLDQEYNALLASVNATISRLGEIQKDDGSIQMNEATAAALAAGSAAVLASAAAAAVAAAVSGSHTHTIAQVTSLQATLDAKATTTALTSGLAAKADTAHTHVVADIPGLSTTLSNKLEATSPPAAKAWVSFDGTTTQPTVISSYNVGSVTRSSAGVYLLTFVVPMTDNNYCWTASARGAAALPVFAFQNTSGNTQTTTQMSIVTTDTTGAVNCPVVNLAVFR